MRKRVFGLFSLLALSALLLAACGPTYAVLPTPTLEDSQSANVGDPTPADPIAVTDTVSAGNEPQSDQQTQPPALLPALPELGFATGEAQLKATDPGQVDLTSGELHLVELFAFW